MLNNKSILITGGTGYFGKNFVKYIYKHYKPKKVIIFSRDEAKQYEMANEFSNKKYNALKFFIGDLVQHGRMM